MIRDNIKIYAIAILSLLLITGLTADAQTKFRKELYFGAKGGMTVSRVGFKPTVEQTVFTGQTAGLLLRMISEPHIGIQVEFNYMQKGWNEKKIPGLEYTYYHQLNSLEIPIMTHANIGDKALRFTLNIGPSVSFLLSDQQGFTPDTPMPAKPERAYWGQPIDSKVEFLFTGGIGTEYRFKKAGSIDLEGRVFYSLSNLYDSKEYIYDPSQSNGIVVTLSYLFQVNRSKK